MDRQLKWAEILEDYEARESWRQSTTWGDIMDKVDPFPGQSYENCSPKRSIGELKHFSGVKRLQEKHLVKEKCTMEKEHLIEVQRLARVKWHTEEKCPRDNLLKNRLIEKHLIEVKCFRDEKRLRKVKCLEEKHWEEEKRLARVKYLGEVKRLQEEKCLKEVERITEEKRLIEVKRLARVKHLTQQKCLRDNLLNNVKHLMEKRLIEETSVMRARATSRM
ncbi:S phase cyclin A-associated protein in the endoplasmic reticulum-like isoform X2 [Lethenteron reissneri]|nr:S phase cyclin A-associated protein in the endoplasmic reticulum-like isoform X2 [Lethenteron reissneri]XP_061435634.1 S phase cyclin A-associated protein in the endoplasmic reticulum-like isoform X2 [Lethenteron reissneri]